MGAGLSKERERQLKYSHLQSVRRELAKVGIQTDYKDKTVVQAGRTADESAFIVSYGRTLRASNGEAFGNMIVYVVNPETGKHENYSLLDANTGIDKIKAFYSPTATAEEKQDAYLAGLRAQIDDAFTEANRRHWGPVQRPGYWDKDKYGDKNAAIFLFDEKGVKFEKNNGEVYAYPEHRNGSVYVRLGTSSWHVNQPVEETDYVEFKIGYTIRNEKGEILVTRTQ